MRLLILILFMSSHAFLQAQNDSIVGYDAFLAQVFRYHPLAQKIKILTDKAAAENLKSKGNFDPKLNGNWQYKNFKQKNYFSIFNAHLNIPTWIGVEVEGGYNHNIGYKLNPENYLPSDGQAYLGIKVPLLKGLLNDERRTAIRQAALLTSINDNEIARGLNDLLFQAAIEYWKWVKLNEEYLVILQSLALARQQFDNTKSAYQSGDIPAIDTLKSYTRIQDRIVKSSEINIKLDNQKNLINAYLWNENNTPVELPPYCSPVRMKRIQIDPIQEDFLDNTRAALNQHPEVQYYNFKLKSLEIDRKLKQNKLLPGLDVKYNFLSNNQFNFFEIPEAPVENYKLAIKLKMPIFLRKERAELKLNALKIRETEFDIDNKIRLLDVKLQNYFNKTNNLIDIVEQTQTMTENYLNLLNAETIKYNLGENTLILLNFRENQYLDAQLKLVKNIHEFLVSKSTFMWLSVNLSNSAIDE